MTTRDLARRANVPTVRPIAPSHRVVVALRDVVSQLAIKRSSIESDRAEILADKLRSMCGASEPKHRWPLLQTAMRWRIARRFAEESARGC